MTSTTGDYEVIVINSVAYMRADSVSLENDFGYSVSEAALYVNRWIGFTPADAPYASVATDVTSGTTWGDPSKSPTDGLPQTPQSVTAPSSRDGRSVQTVAYSLHGASGTSSASYSGTEQISFAADGPHLPYSLIEKLSGTAGGEPSTGMTRVTFSQWGEPVDVSAPTGSIPYSSLPSPTAIA